MIYQKSVTTSRSAQNIARLRLTRGLIYRMEVYLPPGSAGLLGVSIWRGASQLWPLGDEEEFWGDNVNISFEDLYVIEERPYVLEVKTVNEDTLYEHEVIIRVGLVSAKVFMARFLPSLAAEIQKDAWKAMLEAAEEERQAKEEAERERALEEGLPWLREGE